MTTKWRPSNINLFGTKLTDALFSKSELKGGCIEGTEKQLEKYEELDPERLNLIKGNLFFIYLI